MIINLNQITWSTCWILRGYRNHFQFLLFASSILRFRQFQMEIKILATELKCVDFLEMSQSKASTYKACGALRMLWLIRFRMKFVWNTMTKPKDKVNRMISICISRNKRNKKRWIVKWELVLRTRKSILPKNSCFNLD